MSGGSGLLGKAIMQVNKAFRIVAPSSSEMDIRKSEDVERFVREVKPDIFLHSAAFTRPMIRHDEDPATSVLLNIAGTSNVVLACIKHKVKLVYISTDYVYPGTKGNYKEQDDLNPANKYAWSKLGGECAVRLYDNSLILRVAFSQRPFEHAKAFTNSYKSYLYSDEIAPLLLKILATDAKGVMNVGGERRSVYDFAKLSRTDVEKITKEEIGAWVPFDTSMNTELMQQLLDQEKN